MWLTEYDNPEVDCAWDAPASGGESTLSIVDRYSCWLKRGKEIVSDQSRSLWKIADWVVEGQDEFEDLVQPLGRSDRHLLIQRKVISDGAEYFAHPTPSFWTVVSEETGLKGTTLQVYASTARAFPRKKRFLELTFNHHQIVAGRDDRFELLQKCLDVPKGARPRPAGWLEAYIQHQEGTTGLDTIAPNWVHFGVPDGQYAKLKQLTKYLQTNISDLIAKKMNATLNELLEEYARKISFERLQFYDGQWPFEPPQPRQQKPVLRNGGPVVTRSKASRDKQSASIRKAHQRKKTWGTVAIRRIARNEWVE